jgi:hypothetical protein
MYRMLATPPVKVPRRMARKGASEVTGPQRRSSANWMGIAARHLVDISNGA